MKITERPLPPNVQELIVAAAAEAAAGISVSTDAPPLEIVERINAFVADSGKPEEGVDLWSERALPLGALWGQQMVRQFGWEWAEVVQHEHNDFEVTGVFDPSRSLAIYPFHYVFGCLENGVYPTILLAFNMLAAGKIPELEAGGYENLMAGVQHVVPPR